MAEEEVKILIEADGSGARKDFKKTAEEAGKIGTSAKKSTDKAEKGAKQASKGIRKHFGSAVADVMDKLDGLSSPLMALSSIADLASKAFGIVSGAVSRIQDALNKAREATLMLRGEMDPLVVAYREVEFSAGITEAKLGDIAVASEIAYKRTLGPNLKSINKLLKENGGYISEVLTDTKAFFGVVGSYVALLAGTVGTGLLSAIGVIWNSITAFIQKSLETTMSGLRWIISKLPGDWKATLGVMDDAIGSLAKGATEDIEDIMSITKLQGDANEYFATLVIGNVKAANAAGDLAKKLHDSNKEVDYMSKAQAGKAFTDFTIAMRASLDAAVDSFAKPNEKIEETQRRIDNLRESVSNLKENFETQKVEFLSIKEIEDARKQLTMLLGEGGMEVSIDLSSVNAVDQAEALVNAFLAAEQKLGHTSANMSRIISENLAEATRKAADIATHKLKVDLAEKGVGEAKRAFEDLGEKIVEINELIVDVATELASETAQAWATASVEASSAWGEALGVIIADAKNTTEALNNLAESFLNSMLDAIQSTLIANINADTQEEALHQRKLARIVELNEAKSALMAEEGALLALKISMEETKRAAVVTTGVVEKTVAATTTGVVVSGQNTQSSAVQSNAMSHVGLAASSSASGVAQALASIPGGAILAPILATAAATAVVGLLKGLLSSLFAAGAAGGWVTGDIKRKDSVPSMLMPGEYVMPQDEVRGMQSFFAQMGGSVSQSKDAAPQRGNTSFNIEFKSDQLPNRTETRRWVKTTILPALRDLQSQGY